MNAADRYRDQTDMSVNDLEQHLDDLERRHDRTRGLLVDALAVGCILLIGLAFQPEGWPAAILGFCGAIVAPRLITALFLRDRTPAGRGRRTLPAAGGALAQSGAPCDR
jgi:hypothetical protein